MKTALCIKSKHVKNTVCRVCKTKILLIPKGTEFRFHPEHGGIYFAKVDTIDHPHYFAFRKIEKEFFSL